MSDRLADGLRQVADNLDRAASISAQYCCSKHHTDAIREAATRIEELEILVARLERDRPFDRRDGPDPDDDHAEAVRRIAGFGAEGGRP